MVGEVDNQPLYDRVILSKYADVGAEAIVRGFGKYRHSDSESVLRLSCGGRDILRVHPVPQGKSRRALHRAYSLAGFHFSSDLLDCYFLAAICLLSLDSLRIETAQIGS